MTIKKGDFIEIDFTGKILDDNTVFDTTNPKQAEEAGFICNHEHDHEHEHNHISKEDFKPIIICVGEKHVLPGLDEAITGANLGEHDIMLEEDSAFGKKSSKLLKLIPLSTFKKQNIQPYTGLVLDLDNSRGTVKSVSGGRVIMDFNHPLAGKKIKYEINIKRKVENKEEQTKAILNILKLPHEQIHKTNNKITITVNEKIPLDALKYLAEDIKRMTETDTEFKHKEKTKKETTENK